MPLIKSKSKQAFTKNVETEMEHGKPMKQSLAIAYDMKNRNKKKKMAKGGMVNESAKTEQRPMSEERDEDSAMVSRNSSQKPPSEDKWTDQPTVRQAGKLSTTPLSRPKMANGMYKVRDRADVVKEEMLMSKMPPDSPETQPDEEYNEVSPKREGPEVHPMKTMADGGEIEEDHADSIAAAIMAKRDRMHDQIDSGAHDEDDAVMMADGGILSHDSIYADDSSQADLSRNADEDANEEDQLSFNALRKENYSESDGLEQLDSPMDSAQHGDSIDSDEHDMISQIRSKMNRQRQFKVR